MSDRPTPETDTLSSDPAVERRDVPIRVWRTMAKIERQRDEAREQLANEREAVSQLEDENQMLREQLNAAAPQEGQSLETSPQGGRAEPAPAAAHEITDEQGRPMTYWGGLKKPAPAAAPVIYGPEKQSYPGGPVYQDGVSTGAAAPEPAGEMPEEPEYLSAIGQAAIITPTEKVILTYIRALRAHDLALQAGVRELERDLENTRNKVAGCSTAAIGYWKEGDSLHPDYECAAIHDVARLYQRYEQAEAKLREAERLLREARSWVEDCAVNPEVAGHTQAGKLLARIDAALAAQEEKKKDVDNNANRLRRS